MIFGNLHELAYYEKLIPAHQQITSFIEAGNFPAFGEWLVLSDSLRVIRLNTWNRGSDLFETHKDNFDLHFTISGVDKLMFSLEKEAIVSAPYDSERDFSLYTGTLNNEVLISASNWVFVFPHEPHKNQFIEEGTEKLVFKIKVDSWER